MAKYPCSSYTVHKNIFSGEVSGESGSAVWSNAAVFDGAELSKLGDSYAIEVAYNSAVPPVITLQRWSGEAVWSTIQPFYFNGSRACFMADDIIKSLEELGVDYTDLDRISISPYGGEMTMTNVDILVKGTSNEDTVPGDVNADGVVNTSDLINLQKYLLGTGKLTSPSAADIDESGSINILDLLLLKKSLI